MKSLHGRPNKTVLKSRAQGIVESLEAQPFFLPSYAERIELSREELNGQPQAIQQTLVDAERPVSLIAKKIAEYGINQIYITGCGDSFFSAMAVRYAFDRIVRIPTVSIQAFEYTRYYHGPTNSKTLVIALSASGRGPRTVEALLKAKELGAVTIAISNTIDSALFNEADYHIQVQAKRKGGFPTQSSTGAIAALLLLAIEMGKSNESLGIEESIELKKEIYFLPEIVNGLILKYRDEMIKVAEFVKNSSTYFFVGSGPGFAAANIGGAKIKEMSQDHIVVLQLEEYYQSQSIKAGEPFFLIAPNGAGNDKEIQIAYQVKNSGGFLIALTESNNDPITSIADVAFCIPKVREEFSVIPYVIPLQLFGLQLGAIKSPSEEKF